jgi:hypothetical protein
MSVFPTLAHRTTELLRAVRLMSLEALWDVQKQGLFLNPSGSVLSIAAVAVTRLLSTTVVAKKL